MSIGDQAKCFAFFFLAALRMHFIQCIFQLPLLVAFLYTLEDSQPSDGITRYSSILWQYNQFASSSNNGKLWCWYLLWI